MNKLFPYIMHVIRNIHIHCMGGTFLHMFPVLSEFILPPLRIAYEIII